MLMHSRESGNFQQLQALTMCQAALRKIASVPETVDIPPVEDRGNAEQLIFIWDSTTKSIENHTQRNEIEPLGGSVNLMARSPSRKSSA